MNACAHRGLAGLRVCFLSALQWESDKALELDVSSRLHQLSRSACDGSRARGCPDPPMSRFGLYFPGKLSINSLRKRALTFNQKQVDTLRELLIGLIPDPPLIQCAAGDTHLLRRLLVVVELA